MSEIGKNYMSEELKSTETKVKMTVYTALNKRKIYASRLTKLHDTGASFVECALAAETKINGIPREDLENKLKSNYDKAIAIIRNFYSLNAAITRSNALTEITIGGETMTVAEALSRYDKINAEVDLLNSIAKTVASATAKLTRFNTDRLSEEAISKYVTNSIGSINLDSANDELVTGLMNKFREEYIERNTYELIDPYNHADTIEGRMEKLQEFISEFNEALNISNMQTEIEVCLVGDR